MKSAKEFIANAYMALKDTTEHSEIQSICRIIFQERMNWSFAELLLHEDEPLPENLCVELEGIFAQLAKGAPLQYVLGGCDFCGVRLSLTPATLIPRPETAELVQLVAEEVKEARASHDGSSCGSANSSRSSGGSSNSASSGRCCKSGSENSGRDAAGSGRCNTSSSGDSKKNSGSSFKILDVGTGSGCIAIALAKMLESPTEEALPAVEIYGCDISEEALPAVEIYGCDISEEALAVAKRNAEANKSPITLFTMDILDEKSWSETLSRLNSSNVITKTTKTFDLIVSNPPYVRESEKSEIARRVLDYEPESALFVPDSDPLLFYRAICRFGREHLREGGSLWFEINEALGPESRSLIEEEGYCNVLIHKDINEKNRFISATIK